MLVAQALESEVDSRRHNDVNSSKIVCIIRIANMVFIIIYTKFLVIYCKIINFKLN